MPPDSAYPCPLCASRSAPWRRAGGSDLRRCGSCGTAFQADPPGPDELRRIYSKDYYAGWDLNGAFGSLERLKRRGARGVLDEVARWVRPGRILDVGCAMGFLLQEAHELGWEPHGVELNPYAAKLARRRFGAGVHEGTLESLPDSAGPFRAITMIDLVEHVREPGRLVRRARELLEPGGVLAVLTPNLGSASARLMRGVWPHFKREHLFYATKAGMARLMESAGLLPLGTRPAAKTLTLGYAAGLLAVYPLPLLTPLAALAKRTLPGAVLGAPFSFPSGEMLACFRRQ